MSSAAAHLIAAFESLPEQEMQLFAKEILRRTPLDSESLNDEVAARAGEELAAVLDLL